MHLLTANLALSIEPTVGPFRVTPDACVAFEPKARATFVVSTDEELLERSEELATSVNEDVSRLQTLTEVHLKADSKAVQTRIDKISAMPSLYTDKHTSSFLEIDNEKESSIDILQERISPETPKAQALDTPRRIATMPITNSSLADSPAGFSTLNLESMKSSARINQRTFKALSLLIIASAWNEAESEYPNYACLHWYSLLEGLDDLMQRRQMGKVSESVEQAPPSSASTLEGPTLELWEQLQRKSTIGSRQYGQAIAIPLRKSIGNATDKIIDDMAKTPPRLSGNDLLKALPGLGPEGHPPEDDLCDKGVEVLSSAFPDKQIPSSFVQIQDDQARYEDIYAELRPLLAIADNAFSPMDVSMAPSKKAIDDIRNDYHFLVATQLLNLTKDIIKTHDYLEVVGLGI